MSEIYGSISKYDETLSSAKEPLLIYQEINDKKGQATSLNNIGAMNDIFGDYPKALEYYTKSLKIKEEIGDREGQARSLNNIARVYLEQKEYNKSREYFTNAEKIAKELNSKEILRTIAVSFGELELAEELKSKVGEAEALLLQARIMVEQASLPVTQTGMSVPSSVQASLLIDKFKEAILIFEQLKQPFEIAKAYYYYAQSLKLHTPTPLDRGEYLQKAKEIFEKIGAKEWLNKIVNGKGYLSKAQEDIGGDF
ncbi:MAG: tetratricopeptide repeat protein [Candidatus Edwardsbacteria bacterium]